MLEEYQPTTPQEALELLEFQVQDAYDFDPNLRTAVALIEAELERVTGLEKVAQYFDYASRVHVFEALSNDSYLNITVTAKAVQDCRALLKGGDDRDAQDTLPE